MNDDTKYLQSQLITYLGNKRTFLPVIEQEILNIQSLLGKDKTVNVDLFSGSGCVARMLKQYSSLIVANDLERYSQVVNEAFLCNKKDFDMEAYESELTALHKLLDDGVRKTGIISTHYAPADTRHVQPHERAFYTHENALLIDTIRWYIDTISNPKLKNMMLAQLLTEASIHANTSGVFKGFYKDSSTGIGCFGGNGKNALQRIMGKISINKPILSRFESESMVLKKDAKTLFPASGLRADITYIDPPYNQHPYGSNYFMLNLIAENKMPNVVSRVSGIPTDWKRSNYNKKARIRLEFEELINSLNTQYAIISYNNEGFLSHDDLLQILSAHGTVLRDQRIEYTAFRASRNLHKRAKHTQEYLITVEVTK